MPELRIPNSTKSRQSTATVKQLKDVLGNEQNEPKRNINSENVDLSGYEAIKELGRGAYGVVTLHRRLNDNVKVAVKRVNVLNMSAHERQMALNETNVLSTLQHPNIIEYFDSFERNGALLIAMEYADGGNMQEYLSRQEIPLSELKVLNFLLQMSSALTHMHVKNILHRDLKTANIFLTKDEIVKLGDFGISKIQSSQVSEKNTIVGTPYYISPEMCDGKQYNDKSDIWSFGCVAYEMACLHRTFEGTNLPALVHKIVNGQFAPIRGDYSNEFRQLIRDMLQKEPMFRPCAKDIFDNKLPNLIQLCGDQGSCNSSTDQRRNRKLRSVLFKLGFQKGSLELMPVAFPSQHVVLELAISGTHNLALTASAQVYAWGDNSKGQLGLDVKAPNLIIGKPCLVDTLKGKNVKKIGCGEGFSVFACTNGILMTCGDGSKGCLGHGDWNNLSKPKILEKLLCLEVSSVACGPHHVVVIGGEKWAFSWGQGGDGRLGQGDEQNKCSPLEITFSNTPEGLREVRCGLDATVFLTTDRRHVWACGSNTANKLSLDAKANIWSWKKSIVDKALVPKKVTDMPGAVVDVSLGLGHSAFLLDSGEVVNAGSDICRQAGVRRHEDNRNVTVVDSMEERTINMVSCGASFTIAGTTDNALWLWGSPRIPVARKSIPGYQLQHDQFVWGVTPYKSNDSASTAAQPNQPPKKVSFSGCGKY